MKKDETEEMFADRVQNCMAEVGSLVATPFSRHECTEYVKKLKTDQKRTQNKRKRTKFSRFRKYWRIFYL